MVAWSVILLFLLTLIMVGPLQLFPVYGAISLITLLLFAIDKQKAIKSQRRISERSLLTAALCCGWPGALAGRTMFRHKTQKQPFSLWLYLIAAAHFALLIAYRLEPQLLDSLSSLQW